MGTGDLRATGGTSATGGAQATGGGQTTGGAQATGGSQAGSQATGGAQATGGMAAGDGGGRGTPGSGGTSLLGSGGAAGATGGRSADPALAKFSFFVTSLPAILQLSGKAEGFGGDLRFGQADGLAGADEICRRTAEMGLVGAGQKNWRAFLSATTGAAGGAVNARDRIGTGPWYDRMGRLVASNLSGLFAAARPDGDPVVVNDLPNETGAPNHYVGPNGLGTMTVDNHDTLTGSDTMGRLRSTSSADTCNDWSSSVATGRPWLGHSWPRSSATNGQQWASDHQAPGCAAGIDRTLGGSGAGSCVGCGGGFGGIYCFAVTPK